MAPSKSVVTIVPESDVTDEIETVETDETDDDETDETGKRTRQTNYHQPLPVLTMSFHKTIEDLPDVQTWISDWAEQTGLMVEFRSGGRKGASNRLFARFDTPETYAVRTAATVSSGTRAMLNAVKAKAEAQGVSVEDLLRKALENL